jgi:hypothetical protein
LSTVHLRHPIVENYGVYLRIREYIQTLCAAVRRQDNVALRLQHHLAHYETLALVVDTQNFVFLDHLSI